VGSGFLFHPVLTNADAGKEITPRSSYEKLEISKADFNRFALEGCVPCAVSNKRGNHVQQVNNHLSHYHSNRGT
jgi:hypothetical protein